MRSEKRKRFAKNREVQTKIRIHFLFKDTFNPFRVGLILIIFYPRVLPGVIKSWTPLGSFLLMQKDILIR
jgi:hypothetical protein